MGNDDSVVSLVTELTPAGDIYSFGVVCWEISTGNSVDVQAVYKRILNELNKGRLFINLILQFWSNCSVLRAV